MSKIYLIGAAINSYDNEALYKTFMDAEKELVAEGHQVVNLQREFGWHNKQIKEATNTRLSLMLSCDFVYVLPNWQDDAIAKIELITANAVGMKHTMALGSIQPHQLVFFKNP